MPSIAAIAVFLADSLTTRNAAQGIFGMPSMANGLDVQQLLVEVPIAPWEFQW